MGGPARRREATMGKRAEGRPQVHTQPASCRPALPALHPPAGQDRLKRIRRGQHELLVLRPGRDHVVRRDFEPGERARDAVHVQLVSECDRP